MEENLRLAAVASGHGGVVTYGSQTHPGDGTAGLVLSTVEAAREQNGGAGVALVRAVSFAWVERARMPKAPVPAAQAALADAGLTIADLDVVTTHNPFAVNDIYFSRQTGFPDGGGRGLFTGCAAGDTAGAVVVEVTD